MIAEIDKVEIFDIVPLIRCKEISKSMRDFIISKAYRYIDHSDDFYDDNTYYTFETKDNKTIARITQTYNGEYSLTYYCNSVKTSPSSEVEIYRRWQEIEAERKENIQKYIHVLDKAGLNPTYKNAIKNRTFIVAYGEIGGRNYHFYNNEFKMMIQIREDKYDNTFDITDIEEGNIF